MFPRQLAAFFSVEYGILKLQRWLNLLGQPDHKIHVHVNWKDLKMLTQEEERHQTITGEALFIGRQSASLNKDRGLLLPLHDHILPSLCFSPLQFCCHQYIHSWWKISLCALCAIIVEMKGWLLSRLLAVFSIYAVRTSHTSSREFDVVEGCPMANTYKYPCSPRSLIGFNATLTLSRNQSSYQPFTSLSATSGEDWHSKPSSPLYDVIASLDDLDLRS